MSLNSGERAVVLCTKITDICSECDKSLNSGASEDVGYTKVGTSGRTSVGL
jgi:hypothetical protein